MTDDATLLRRYATEQAEDAFAEFVRRHLPLVYSAAARRLGVHRHRAEQPQAATAETENEITRNNPSGWFDCS